MIFVQTKLHDHDWKATLRFLMAQMLTGLRIVLSTGAIMAAMAHRGTIAAKLIPLAVVTDILDGPVASKLGIQSEFGALFDYFADYLSYIVAPVMLTCSLLRLGDIAFPALLLMLPLLTGAIRYSRNAVLLRTESFAQLGFPGLLTVCYALFVVGVVLVDLENLLGVKYLGTLLYTIIPIQSVLMISRVRYPKLTISKIVGAVVVAFLLCLPFVLTKPLAALMLCVIFAYIFASPLLLKSSSTPRWKRTPSKPLPDDLRSG